jgi:periplasmic protein TonB
MAKPLRTSDPGQPQSRQFAHFGVLDDGAQSKASTLSAVGINIFLGFVIIILGAAARQEVKKKTLDSVVFTPVVKPIEPIKPKIIPKPPPKLPEVPKIVVQPPKITVPVIKPPDTPPVVVHMDIPKPVIMQAAAPPKVVAPPAPKVVSLAPAPAAVANNSAHPAAVALGSPNNPIAVSKSAAVSPINLGNAGQPGMNKNSTGQGAVSPVSLAGSGSPNGQAMKGPMGPVAINGLAKGGTPGGQGKAVGGPAQVTLAVNNTPPPPQQHLAAAPAQRSVPKVVFKPTPLYTAEAKAAHLEGSVQIKIRVLPDGSTQVLGVTSGLGKGLDESAVQVARGMKFQPALDAAGTPIPWEGVVSVNFLLAG